MKIQNVQQLMTTAMTYVLDMEEKLAEAAPIMADASSNPELKEFFNKTASKSKEYATRVEEAFAQLGESVQRNDNHITDAMIREVQEMIKNTDEGPVRDAALIVAANQQQLFRVASYGSLESYAKVIDKSESVNGIRESLEESKAGDKKLTELAENKINQAAVKADEKAMQSA